jgi:uncharacterized repeat protein (TIGR01451 family)/gliding motility-associated-like protein
MIKNYATVNLILNFKKAIFLFFVFFMFSQISSAQCAKPAVGCSTTDLSNFGFASNNDAATIEYDNFVSSWHTTVVRTSDGSFQTWGETIGNNGTTNVLAPLTINKTNFSGLTTGATPLKVALGSNSSNNVQGILLATDGLYAWSLRGAVIDATLTTSAAFQKVTIGGNANGLPTGVVPGDVKMMFATFKTLVITTCSGDVWVISQIPNARGNGATGNNTTWYKVTTSATGNPFLTDVVACRGSADGLMALKSDGSVYVWGTNALLGDTTGYLTQTRAIKMTLPSGITPKMIGSTGPNTARSYYVLATDGNLYALGKNNTKQLGDWTTTDRFAWVQPRYTSATGPVMNDIKWFSPQEHDFNYGAVNVLNNSKNIYAFGNNSGFLIGTTGTSSDPSIPNGLVAGNSILAVETGGHTSMIVKSCEAKFGYVGHRISGSMGDGTNASTNEANYTFATANVQICGAESNPAIQPISTGGGPDSKYCVGDPVLLSPTPAGGTLSVLSGPGTLTGNTVNFTAAGTVVVQYSVTTACGGTSVTSKSFDAALCPIDLQITKTVDNLTPSVGSNSVFTITTKNNGTYKGTGITVNDALPAGYTFVSATPSTGTWLSPNWTVGNLASGTSATLSIVATVNASGPYANTATVTGNDPDTDLTNNTATATPVVQTNLTVTKTINNTTPNIGSNVTFTITASNAGPSNATGVIVNDVLPAGYTFVSATPSTGTWSAPDWTIGGLANGATATIAIVATVNASGSYTNTATITGGQNDPTPGNNSESVTPVVNKTPVANANTNASIPSTAGATAISALTATDTDGTIANYTVLSLPTHGVLALSGTPVTLNQVLTPAQVSLLTYDPIGTFTGDDTFTFTATDNQGAVATAATITIPVGNNPPVANADTNNSIPSTAGATAINALTATDTDGTIANYTVLSLPAHGTLALSGVAITANQVLTPAQVSLLTYDPAGTFTGNDTFTFTATDNSGAVATAATITIPVGNNPPVANADTNTSIPSTAGATAINALTATDTDGTIANYTVLSLPAHGTLALSGVAVTLNQVLTPAQAAMLTYDPIGTFTGDDTFTFTATDNSGATATAATITIPVGNNAPVANANTNSSIPSTAGATAISALTATDTDGTIANYTVLSLPTHGTLALAGTPVTLNQILTPAQAAMLTYDPIGTFTGDDTFTFTATDNSGAVATGATITIPVGNNPPVANADTNTSIPSTAGATAISALTATDTDGTIANYTVLSLPTHGVLALSGTPVTLNQVLTPAQVSLLTYDPAGTFTGDDTFTFTATDNLGVVATAATITIPVGNNPPVANANTNASIPSSASATAISALTATDTDGTIASYTVLSLPTHGILALAGTPVTLNQVLTPAQAAMLTYDPIGTFTGDDTFTFTATDNSGAVATAVTITIPVGNNPPVANADTNNSIPSTAGATAINALTATDTDGTIASYTVLSLPAHGTLALAGTPVTLNQVLTPAQVSLLTYDPIGTFTGDDTFTFTATDNSGAVATAATITIPVGNNPPVANADTNNSIPSTAGATAINALNATDTDGTIANYTVLSLPTHGTLALAGTPVTLNQVLTPAQAAMLTYDPIGTFTGDDTFSFTATDNSGAVATAATITIPVGNNPPVANADTNTSIPSTAGATAINALTATDTDGTIANYTVLSLPTHGTLALSGVAVTANQVLTPAQVSLLTYDPIGTFTGDDTFTFTATDNNGAVATAATITIPVGNNPPVANADTNNSIPSTAGATAINALTATDTDGTIASYTVLSLPTHGTLALSGVAVTANQILTPAQVSLLTYDPIGTFTGDDTFTFTATDNSGAVATAATITIPVGNNPPVANANTNASIASSASATAISALTATDTDGTIANYTVLSLPTHGTLALAGTPVTLNQVLTPAQAAMLTYDPIGTFTGDDTFTFTATDNSGAVATSATITIPVGNNPPVANADTNNSIPSTAGATAINALTAADTDGTIASYTVLSLPTHGTLALSGTPVTLNQVLTPAQVSLLTYDPAGTFTGDDTFTFTATDNLGVVATAATITIPVGNNPPVANANTNASIPSSASATAISALTATDTDGTIASYTVLSLPTHGTLALAGTPVTLNQVLTPAQAAMLTYDPIGTFTGDDTFTFTATDNSGAVATAATITIPVGNNPPVANADTNNSIPSTAGATAINALTATDTDGTIASYTVLSLPAHGTLALSGVAVTANQVLTPAQVSLLTYDPIGTFTGDDTFTFTATDNLGAIATAATITIPVGNNPPVANADTNNSIPSTAGATAINALTATDTDGTIANYTVLSLPTHGTLALAGTPVTLNQVLTPAQAAMLTYDPIGTFTGDDTFSFTATDNSGAVATAATITIPVGNNPPVANADTNTSIPSTAGATAINALTATDTDGTIASYTVLSLPAHGTLALSGVAVTANQILTPAQVSLLTYDPIGTFTGNDTFTFTATDNLGAVATAATITIPVANNAPDAHDDTNAAIPSRAGATAINALTATDTDGTIASYTVLSLPANGILALAGVPVTLNQLLTPAQAAMLTYDPNGAFTGNDTFTFTATDNNGAIDATPAVITIVIEKTVLNAVSDPINAVVGINKPVTVLNVFNNDTLNNDPLVPSDVNLGVRVPDPTGTLTLKPDGTIELIPNAPAGTYSLTYEICEAANIFNCSSAVVTVTVVAPTMTVSASSYCSNNTPYVSYNVVADNFTPTGLLTINWIDSANNIVATQNNMPLSGTVLWPGAVVDGSNNPTDWPGWILTGGQWLQGNDGFELTRPAVTMQFTLNPTKSVVVNYPGAASGCNAMPTFGIQAGNEDDLTLADGLNGSPEVINVLDNDKLNGVPVKASDVILKGLDLPKGITINADGTIDVAPGTKGGNYTLTYQICEVANASNCTTATVKIFVEVPAIAIVKTVVLNDNNGNEYAEAGETLTYSFAITNTGNTALENIVVADPLPGIVMSGGPISLAAGQSDTSSITGTYTLTQNDINAGTISNQAIVSGVTKSGIAVSDKSDSGDLNGEKPTILTLSGCVIKIFNAVSSNGDGKNERFYVQGLECYPDNTVQIYNRWGVLVFDRDHYNNTDIAFRGISEGRVTIKDSNGLPEGTYYYIIRYKDKQSNPHQEAGYLYLTK